MSNYSGFDVVFRDASTTVRPNQSLTTHCRSQYACFCGKNPFVSPWCCCDDSVCNSQAVEGTCCRNSRRRWKICCSATGCCCVHISQCDTTLVSFSNCEFERSHSTNYFGVSSTLNVILISRQGNSRQNTNNSHHDHQFDEGETFLQIAFHKKLLGGVGENKKSKRRVYMSTDCAKLKSNAFLPLLCGLASRADVSCREWGFDGDIFCHLR